MQQQAEEIATEFSKIQNEYKPLKTVDIEVPAFSESEIPQFNPAEVWAVLTKLSVNKATVTGDLPAKVIKVFAAYLAEPLCDIINTSIRRGEYPNIFKFEISTPVPKIHPTETTKQLRNISGLMNFDKVMEKLLSRLIISDMQDKLNPSQYGNQPGLSINHYLVKMLHRILTAVDENSNEKKFAVIASYIDWNNALATLVTD